LGYAGIVRLSWIVVAGALAQVAIGSGDGFADDLPPGYDIKLAPASVEAVTGAEGEVSLTIAPAEGYSIDRDGPLRITVAVEPAEGLDVPRRRYRRDDAADVRAEAPRFDLRYKAVKDGDYVMTIAARFWICRRYTCRSVREKRRVPVRVAPPAPPPAPPPNDAGPS
jgi:hypothetical protein